MHLKRKTKANERKKQNLSKDLYLVEYLVRVIRMWTNKWSRLFQFRSILVDFNLYFGTNHTLHLSYVHKWPFYFLFVLFIFFSFLLLFMTYRFQTVFICVFSIWCYCNCEYLYLCCRHCCLLMMMLLLPADDGFLCFILLQRVFFGNREIKLKKKEYEKKQIKRDKIKQNRYEDRYIYRGFACSCVECMEHRTHIWLRSFLLLHLIFMLLLLFFFFFAIVK